MAERDILIFMSDQHSPYFSGWLGNQVDTPNLEALCADGTRFDEAYTACPLCVPARMAMMSGLLPHKTGVFTNFNSFPNTQPSILHPLAAAGYETILCGRMHFVGIDQRHGFTKRIAPDTTPVGWKRPTEKLQEERGVFGPAYIASGATRFVGGGESPVINYDCVVIRAALDYLSMDHEKPQCIVVGTYAPHFPYVAPKELYQKYLERVQVPELFYERPEYMNEILLSQCNPDVTEEKVKGALAAYCGLTELMDAQLGEVRQAFEEFCERRGRQGIFCYLSDHGDQVGDRGIFGKDTFFEKSSKIPMIFSGEGIEKGAVCKAAVSILDMGPTLWELLGSERLPSYDGISLAPVLRGTPAAADRIVACEHLFKRENRYIHGLMLKQGRYKYISYHGMNEMLFNTEDDPLEKKNLLGELPGLAARFRSYGADLVNPDMTEQQQRVTERTLCWFRAWEDAAGLDERERWQGNPPEARVKPELCIE